MNLYRTYSNYLRDRYGEPVYRISVDAGFSCPNRAHGRESRGCSFCEVAGSRAVYQRHESVGWAQDTPDYTGDAPNSTGYDPFDVRQQVERAAAFLERRYDARRYLLYFQAFSNTHGKPEDLRRIYDETLALAPFEELIVSTRPDCIDEDRSDLLASYGKELSDVWVELGLQTSHDETLERISRGHSSDDFLRAYGLLKERGIKVAVHLILGLPGEGTNEIRETAEWVAALKPDAVKIHNLHIPEGTALFEEYLLGETVVPTLRRHLAWTIDVLERLPPETVIMRITCDTPKHRRALPQRFGHKGRFMALLERELISQGRFQGRLYSRP